MYMRGGVYASAYLHTSVSIQEKKRGERGLGTARACTCGVPALWVGTALGRCGLLDSYPSVEPEDNSEHTAT